MILIFRAIQRVHEYVGDAVLWLLNFLKGDTYLKYEGNPSVGFPDFELCIMIALLLYLVLQFFFIYKNKFIS